MTSSVSGGERWGKSGGESWSVGSGGESSRRKEQFWVCAGAGHCGTTWLSQVFGTQLDWVGFHELRYESLQTGWTNARNKDSKPYWDRIREELKTRNVFDSNSWAPFELPLVNQVQQIDRVIYLVRNGIQQMHSLKTQSPVWSRQPITSYAYDGWLRDWWTVSEQTKPFDKMSRFERLCLLIQGHMFMPQYLLKQGLNVVVYRLEDLTNDVDTLTQLVPLDPDVLRDWQARDINRKVEGDRTPSKLWRSWTAAERATFMDMCRPAMIQYGYVMPQTLGVVGDRYDSSDDRKFGAVWTPIGSRIKDIGP